MRRGMADHPDIPTHTDLKCLRQMCLPVAAADTALDAASYRRGTLIGHCAVVAYVVQAFYGGCLVTGRVNGERHLWNRLTDGLDVDLTSDQFGGDGFHPLTKGRVLPPRTTINPRCRLFYDRFLAYHSSMCQEA